MNNTGLTIENLISTFPEALKSDSKLAAMASIIAKKLADRPDEIKSILIYMSIDYLPEELLDILAYDFKVDWWDPEYSLTEKRKILKDSFRIHRIKGTPGAVEDAISAIYPNTKVVEWFDYEGDPYSFKLQIDAAYENIDPIKHQRVLDRVKYYKNLRSHLEAVEYVSEADSIMNTYVGAAPAETLITFEVGVKVYGME